MLHYCNTSVMETTTISQILVTWICQCEGINTLWKVLPIIKCFVLPCIGLAELPQNWWCPVQEESSRCSRCQFEFIFVISRTTFLKLCIRLFRAHLPDALSGTSSSSSRNLHLLGSVLCFLLVASSGSQFAGNLTDEKLRANTHALISQPQ